MRLFWIAVIIGFCVVPPTATATAAPTISAVEIARVDGAIGQMVDNGVPGVALAIVKNGVVVYAHGYGVMDLESRRPITATTLMEIGSVTKQFTAAAILQLSEAGKLSLDDKLGKYVPGYAIGRDVTLRQLLQQTSGIPDYYPSDDGEAAKVFDQHPSIRRVFDLFVDKPLDFPAGTDFGAPNNTDHFLLGQVIERVSRTSYEAYIRRNLFARAGMKRSTTMAHEAGLRDFPSGYWFVGGTLNKATPTDNLWGLATFNIVSDVGDIAKWNAALLVGKIIRRDDVALMMAPGTLADGKPIPMGHGMSWLNTTVENHRMTWGTGGTSGFGATDAIFPDDHLQVIALTNATFTVVEPSWITRAVLLALYPDAAARRTASVAGEDEAITGKVLQTILALRAGTLIPSQESAEFGKAFTKEKLEEFKNFLAPLGAFDGLIFKGRHSTGNVTDYDYLARFKVVDFHFILSLDAQGKIVSMDFS